MKILAEEIVTRYHVEFDEEETLLLKLVGFLPPYAEPRARLWSTQAEIDETKRILTPPPSSSSSSPPSSPSASVQPRAKEPTP